MKFDKFMNFCFKGLCLCLACFILAGFCVSCFHFPVTAHADSVDPVFMAQQAVGFKENLEQGFVIAENAILTDIKNGNLDMTSQLAKDYLTGLALQSMCIYSPTFSTVYHSADLVLQGLPSDLFDNPSELHIDGSSVAGYYYYNNELKTGFIYLPTSSGAFTLFSSSDMSIHVVPSNTSVNWQKSVSQSSATWACQFGVTAPAISIDVSSSSNLQSDFVVPSRIAAGIRFSNPYTSSTPPTWTTGSFVVDSNNQPNRSLIGLSTGVSLPEADIDSDNPSEYYNNVLLPYIRQTYPTMPDRYIVFPNGYDYQDPTEPPTIPNGGIYIDKQFNIGINIITPTDSNGQPVTDASGETVTETVYVTETYPPDGDYRFQLPTLDTLTMYQATVPNPDISSFTDGFAFIWNCVDHFFNDTGFMPVVIACLSMSVLAFVLWKVGG